MSRGPVQPARSSCAALVLLLFSLVLMSAPARADAADPTTMLRPVQGEPAATPTQNDPTSAPSSVCAARCPPCAATAGVDHPADADAWADGEPAGTRRTVDLNKADESALLELPGIGPARARAILAYRVSHGGFHSIAQLLHIKGIGRSLLKQLRPLVTLSGGPS